MKNFGKAMRNTPIKSVNLFRNRVLTDVIKLRSQLEWVLIQCELCPYTVRIIYEEKDTQGNCLVMMEAEVGVMELKAGNA